VVGRSYFFRSIGVKPDRAFEYRAFELTSDLAVYTRDGRPVTAPCNTSWTQAFKLLLSRPALVAIARWRLGSTRRTNFPEKGFSGTSFRAVQKSS
jgi:hypothetical protein